MLMLRCCRDMDSDSSGASNSWLHADAVSWLCLFPAVAIFLLLLSSLLLLLMLSLPSKVWFVFVIPAATSLVVAIVSVVAIDYTIAFAAVAATSIC